MANMAEPNKSRDVFCPHFNSKPLGGGGGEPQKESEGASSNFPLTSYNSVC